MLIFKVLMSTEVAIAGVIVGFIYCMDIIFGLSFLNSKEKSKAQKIEIILTVILFVSIILMIANFSYLRALFNI